MFIMSKKMDFPPRNLRVGEREYTAHMRKLNGVIFEVVVRAFHTADALRKIKDSVDEDSTFVNITISDEDGNIF